MGRFLVDEDLPRSLSLRLAGAGHDVVHVTDVGLRGQPDDAVFAHAQTETRVLVTRDMGFSNILHFAPGGHAGIVVARFPTTTPVHELVARLATAISELTDDELRGALAIVSPRGTRLRRHR